MDRFDKNLMSYTQLSIEHKNIILKKIIHPKIIKIKILNILESYINSLEEICIDLIKIP